MNPLPSYENPPVVEVALSLQFEPLDKLRAAHFGLLWGPFRKEGFSVVEDHGPLDPVVEQFESAPSQIGVRLFSDAPPLPRVWLLNSAGTELVQIQTDRLVVNWRSGAGTDPYPHYSSIRKRFERALQVMKEVLEDEKIGAIRPTQCELTYVNHILADKSWSTHGDVAQITPLWLGTYSDSFLGKPEDVFFNARFRMTDPNDAAIGRLHISLQPAFQREDKSPIFIITMTGRGQPVPPTDEGVFALFDRQHEWIVRGFTSITTSELHKIWRRTN